ncbi:MAG: MBL fold metallo-hydrolase, partial [Vicinamibacterales bacterium]
MTRAVALVAALAILGAAHALRAQQGPPSSADPAGIEVLPVRGNVSMLVGRGGNVTVQTGDEGILVVDSQFGDGSEALLAAVRGLSDRPLRYIVNTHLHPDHIGGNEQLGRVGSTRAGGNVLGNIGADASRTTIVAHENVLTRLAAAGGPDAVPFALWPTDTFFTRQRDLLFNDEAVQMFHQPNAHTDGDIMVFFRRSDVLATGDVFTTTAYPEIDVANGGHINGIVDALNRIIEIAVPSNVQEGGTMIVPGHGRLCDEWEVVEYRDMVTIVRDRIAAMVARGQSLEQVIAARPTLDYDARFGADSGRWTTAMFV